MSSEFVFPPTGNSDPTTAFLSNLINASPSGLHLLDDLENLPGHSNDDEDMPQSLMAGLGPTSQSSAINTVPGAGFIPMPTNPNQLSSAFLRTVKRVKNLEGPSETDFDNFCSV